MDVRRCQAEGTGGAYEAGGRIGRQREGQASSKAERGTSKQIGGRKDREASRNADRREEEEKMEADGRKRNSEERGGRRAKHTGRSEEKKARRKVGGKKIGRQENRQGCR